MEPYVLAKAPSARIRIFLNPQLFLSGYGNRPQASGEFNSESTYFKSALQSEKNHMLSDSLRI